MILGDYEVLHICDKSREPDRSSPDYDKLYKVRLFLKMMVYQFECLYNLRPEMMIDKVMVPFKGSPIQREVQFKGRSHAKGGILLQYMKDRPTK